LIDKSALVRLGASPDVECWAERIERGLVRITTVPLLEVGYSARDAGELRAGLREAPVSMPVEYVTPTSRPRPAHHLRITEIRKPRRETAADRPP
jgi:hypothetical protein